MGGGGLYMEKVRGRRRGGGMRLRGGGSEFGMHEFTCSSFVSVGVAQDWVDAFLFRPAVRRRRVSGPRALCTPPRAGMHGRGGLHLPAGQLVAPGAPPPPPPTPGDPLPHTPPLWAGVSGRPL